MHPYSSGGLYPSSSQCHRRTFFLNSQGNIQQFEGKSTSCLTTNRALSSWIVIILHQATNKFKIPWPWFTSLPFADHVFHMRSSTESNEKTSQTWGSYIFLHVVCFVVGGFPVFPIIFRPFPGWVVSEKTTVLKAWTKRRPSAFLRGPWIPHRLTTGYNPQNAWQISRKDQDLYQHQTWRT